jgi:hypothetical protein
MEDKKGVPAAGILMALCCHHRCDWGSYAGKDFMLVCTYITVSVQTMYHHQFCHHCCHCHHHHVYESTGIVITMDVFNKQG